MCLVCVCLCVFQCYQSTCSLLALACFAVSDRREKKKNKTGGEVEKVNGGLTRSSDGENRDQRREKGR